MLRGSCHRCGRSPGEPPPGPCSGVLTRVQTGGGAEERRGLRELSCLSGGASERHLDAGTAGTVQMRKMKGTCQGSVCCLL